MKNKKWLLMSVVLNVALVFMLVFVVHSTVGISSVISKAKSLVTDSAEASDHSDRYLTLVSNFEEKDITPDGIVFLGDSLTEMNQWTEAFNATVYNRGVYGDNSQGVLDRLEQITKSNPSKVFLMIGINDLAQGIDKEKVLDNYKSIIEQLSDTDLYIQSILPLDTSNYKRVDNEDILWINNQLKELSKENDYTFIDLYPSFLDGNNKIDNTWTIDGLHLNGNGYNLWEDLIREHVEG